VSKIAVLDFDGVIADMTAHAQIAREQAKAFALQHAPDPESAAYRKAAGAFFIVNKDFLTAICSNWTNLSPALPKRSGSP
jgi:hypothetical protein